MNLRWSSSRIKFYLSPHEHTHRDGFRVKINNLHAWKRRQCIQQNLDSVLIQRRGKFRQLVRRAYYRSQMHKRFTAIHSENSGLVDGYMCTCERESVLRKNSLTPANDLARSCYVTLLVSHRFQKLRIPLFANFSSKYKFNI